ncbi:MAG: hypothetical protein MJ213_02970 [Bacilli bacterium]|nr:hypothetical protein [Bacilli bacterium]
MAKYNKPKSQFKHHKGYRWIALFAKLLAGPLFAYAFSGITYPMPYGHQTIGTFLSTTLTLVVYYGIIFVLNRHRNFEEKPPLGKPLAVYILVILNLMSIESAFSGVIQNFFYNITGFGLINPNEVISIANVNNKLVYNLIGMGVHFVFGYITGILIFVLFKHVLSKEEVLAKI